MIAVSKGITLTCVSCGQVFEPRKDLYTCLACGPYLGTLEVGYPMETLKTQIKQSDFHKHGSLFQFEALLPVGSGTPIDKAVGGTPLLAFEGVLGLKRLLIKHDGVSLSASYKDRATVMAMNLALAGGYETIFCASTGNAASSLAILTAHSALKTVIFVPETIPKAKLAQLLAAGAMVHKIQGTYDDAFEVSLAEGLSKGWYCRNSAINPYLLEGKKTGAFEILVQNDFVVPDFCFVGVGDGTVVSGLIKGFDEFRQLGLVDRVPKMIGVQPEGAMTLKRVFDRGAPYAPIKEAVCTMADSICVGNPRDVVKACQYMARNGGYFETVTDDEIAAAVIEMTTKTGVFAEPAGAVSYAALKKMVARGEIGPDQVAVLVVTGSGLKDPPKLTE